MLSGPSPSSPLCFGRRKGFREALRVASGKYIPRGHRREVIPGLTEEAKALIGERDAARSVSHDDPCVAVLNDRIKALVASSSRQAWTEKVMAAGPSENTSTTSFGLFSAPSPVNDHPTPPTNQFHSDRPLF